MPNSNELRWQEFDIDGMVCGACAARLTQVLERAEGVSAARINLALERANIQFETGKVSVDELARVVVHAGFEVRQMDLRFEVGGLVSSTCEQRVRQVLMSAEGVLAADVSIALDRAQVTALSPVVSISELVTRVEHAGYRLVPMTGSLTDENRLQRQWAAEQRTLRAAILLTLPLIAQMIMQFLGYEWFHLMPAWEVALATPLQFVIGGRFYRAAWSAVKSGYANMDVLVVLGTSAAYLYSWYLILTLGERAEGELYFEASAVILMLVLLGKHLESRAKRGTTAAIRQLLELRPDAADVRMPNGSIVRRDIRSLQVGDIAICRPGDRVPVDGSIEAGTAHIDESLVTGEPIPSVRTVGDRVIGGSINADGLLEIRVEAIGEDSTLQRIARLVEQAQSGRIAVQRTVDFISGIFVPVVIAIAILTLIGWLGFSGSVEQAVVGAVSVLVIACPCALGLATPTATISGTGAAARAGILVRDLSALEIAHRVQTVLMDKTGTITAGRPVLAGVEPVGDWTESEVLRIAASIESGSEHPVARALISAAAKAGLEIEAVEKFRAEPAVGVEGVLSGTTYALGSARLLATKGIDLPDRDRSSANVVWLLQGSTVMARFQIRDEVRPTSRSAVAALLKRDLQVELLSGDSQAAVDEVAAYVGIERAQGGLTPGEKADRISELMTDGKIVAMVGDGLNDAPALATASIGIAMSSGTDIAMEAAPVTLMRPDPRLVEALLDVSMKTLRKIKQNLFWAFLYNLMALPVAAAGMLNPTIAGLAMSFSSVSVVLNSLLLRRWKPRLAPVDPSSSD